MHKNVTGESVKYRGKGWVTDHETEQSNKKVLFSEFFKTIVHDMFACVHRIVRMHQIVWRQQEENVQVA